MAHKKINEEDSSTLNLPIWPLDGALYTSRLFGGRRWPQGKTSGNFGENHSFSLSLYAPKLSNIRNFSKFSSTTVSRAILSYQYQPH
jgi:hypothetical protein